MEAGWYGEDRTQRMMRAQVQDRWMDVYAPARHLDPILVITPLVLAGIGLVMIYSAKLHQLQLEARPTDLYLNRQMIALGVGIVAMVVAAVVHYRFFRVYSPVLYLFSLVGLALVLSPLGVEVNGAKAWVNLGGFQFQPVEFAKVGLILAIAAMLYERREDPGLLTVVLAVLLTAPVLGLVMLQPDLGSATIVLGIVFVMLLASGIRARYLIALVGLGVLGIVLAVQTGQLDDHQLARITALVSEERSGLEDYRYHTDQSMIAIGSGRLIGKGLFNGTQTGLSYVPENQTDFIFTVVGEETGFLGASVVLGLFLVLIWRGLRIAMMAKDRFGLVVASGAVGLIMLQVFVNVGMAVGIVPVIGIPLPFVSYGGTSLIANLVLVGLLLNVHMRRF